MVIYKNTEQLAKWLRDDGSPEIAVLDHFEFDDAEYQQHLAELKKTNCPPAERADRAAFRCHTFEKPRPKQPEQSYAAVQAQQAQVLKLQAQKLRDDAQFQTTQKELLVTLNKTVHDTKKELAAVVNSQREDMAKCVELAKTELKDDISRLKVACEFAEVDHAALLHEAKEHFDREIKSIKRRSWFFALLIALLGLLVFASSAHAQTTNVNPATAATSQPTYVDGTRVPLSTDTSGSLRVTITGGAGSGGTSATDNSVFNGGSSAVTPAGALYDTTPPSITDGNIGAPRMNVNRILMVDCQSGCAGAAGDSTATGNLNAGNAAVSIALSTYNGVSANFTSGGSLVGTVVAEVSHDGGTTWVSAVFADPTTGAVSTSLVNPTSGNYTILYIGPISHMRLRVSAFTSGATTGNLRATATRPFSVNVGSDGSNLRVMRTATDGTVRVDPTGTTTQPVNVTQLAGTTTATNSGNTSAGTLRVVLATDQPQLTNKLLVTPDANSAVNVAQMNGVAVTMGNGTAGTGVQRVAIASDNTAFSVNPLSATAPVSTMNSASANSGVNTANAAVFDDASPTTITENNFGFLRMSANRNAYQTIRDAAGNERGANVNASNQLSVSVDNSNVSTNVAQIAGTTTLTGAGNTGAGSQRVTIASDQAPIQVVPWSSGTLVSGAITSAMTGTTSTSLVSGTASNYLYISSCAFSNDHASTDTNILLQDGSGGTTLWKGLVPHGGGSNITFPVPLKVPTSGNALYAQNVTTGSSTYASCNGFKSTVSY